YIKPRNSFEGWDFCGSPTLMSVTSNSAYRNRVCVHIANVELQCGRLTQSIKKKRNEEVNFYRYGNEYFKKKQKYVQQNIIVIKHYQLRVLDTQAETELCESS